MSPDRRYLSDWLNTGAEEDPEPAFGVRPPGLVGEGGLFALISQELLELRGEFVGGRDVGRAEHRRLRPR